MDDETPTEKPPEAPNGPPRLKIVKDPRGQITAAMYEQLAKAWLESPTRTMRGLARDTGLSQDTCTKAINVGWPERGWPSLRERAKLYDAQVQARNDTPSLTPQQLVDVRRFLEVRTEILDMCRSLRAYGALIANKVRDALPGATASRYGKRHRVVDVKVGKKTIQRVVVDDVELPPQLTDMAAIMRDVSHFLMSASEQEKRWLKVEPPEGDAPLQSGWEDMTDEQLAYVAKTGKLPPGFTRESLRAKK